MPLSFIENRGQLDPNVAYYVQGRDTTVYFTREGITFALIERKRERKRSNGSLENASLRRDPMEERESASRWVAKLEFVGANPNPTIAAADRRPGVVSYFRGPQENWKTGLATYGSIVYSDVWPGIDLVYSGTPNSLKQTFLIKPGVEPETIRLAYRGVSRIGLSDSGQLDVQTPAGGFRDEKPYAYQDIGGRRVEINAKYSLENGEESHGYGFELGSYDRTTPLVLDPAVLLYCGYIGGTGSDYGNAIAVDGSGNAYVTGRTSSTDATFPMAVGPDLTFNGGNVDGSDAFVAKINPAGTALVYCGYIGGSGDDYGNAIAVDSSGSAYVAGYTFSTETTFPVTVGPDLTSNGFSDAFVAKVNDTGTSLIYCGYIGGAGTDAAYGIAVDGSGNAYVAGNTNSIETTFPAIVGPDLTENGLQDVFVAKVNQAGSALVYCGYIGGSSLDQAHGIAVDGSGNAYVTGQSLSTEATFPVTGGPDLTSNGGFDAFIAKVNASGTALVYCGYIGGSDYDGGYGIALDRVGNAYVVGTTASTATTFPATIGPDLNYNGGPYDVFVAKVNPAGTALVYCGYIGGSGYEFGRAIAVDSSGNAYVTGETSSTETSFPVTIGPDLTYNGGPYDVFVARVNQAGTALAYCGYIGGGDSEVGYGIALDSSRNAYLTGYTTSSESTFPVTGGPDLTYNGNFDAFVAKIEVGTIPVTSLTPSSGPASGVPGVSVGGSSFVSGASVDFGATPASNVVVNGANQITVDVPSLSAGIVYPVTVTNPDLSSGTLTNGWFADFLDVPGSHPFHNFIEKLARNAITAGCGSGNYCPTSPVTRAQIAVFLLRSKEGPSYTPPACTTPAFADVPCSSPFAPWINELAVRSVTVGCGGGNYCPSEAATRAQMAVFLLRTHDGPSYTPPACVTPTFLDVPCSSPFAPWIDELALRGITSGCGGGNFCPTNPVTRGQMAVFLVTTFELP